MKKFRGFQAVSRLKKENIEVIYPKRNDLRSAAYDFYYLYDTPTIIQPGETKIIKSGIKSFMLDDECLDINTRSGNGAKRNLVLANSIGWIDSSYYNNPDNEGEIMVALRNEGTKPFTIEKGDKYCQARFTKYLTADIDIVVNNNRIGGLGSSGKK